MAADDDDRFGMPQSAFEAALNSHGRDNPVYRVGMYVPTRREVATLPIEDHALGWELALPSTTAHTPGGTTRLYMTCSAVRLLQDSRGDR